MIKIISALALAGFVTACGGSTPAAADPTSTTGAPADPSGAATAATGTAAEGATCGDGVMGAPNIQCASGLVCDTSAGTAPNPPAGAQGSARGGVCKKAP